MVGLWFEVAKKNGLRNAVSGNPAALFSQVCTGTTVAA
jgi:hypothetical protein